MDTTDSLQRRRPKVPMLMLLLFLTAACEQHGTIRCDRSSDEPRKKADPACEGPVLPRLPRG